MATHSIIRTARHVALTVATAVVVAPSCTVTEPTEFVPGVSTQVSVPKDLAGITMEVSSGGTAGQCWQYNVMDGTVTLPGTLGVIPGGSGATPTTPVTITVRGYTRDGVNGPTYNQCGATQGDPNDYTVNPRILRRSIVSFVDQKTLFLPFPLKFACFDQTACLDTQTCKGGVCVDATVDAGALPVYEPGMGDGTSANCFDPDACFRDRMPAFPVDLGACKFTFPSAPVGSGLNVQAFYGSSTDHQTDGGADNQAEYLDQDPEEGFIVEPSNPTQFTLAPGLCQMFQRYLALKGASDAGMPDAGSKLIYSLDMASACPPKSLAQPICASAAQMIVLEDAGADPVTGATCSFTTTNVLSPAPSALLVMLDRGEDMSPVYGADTFGKVLSFSLGAASFANNELGMKFIPTATNACTDQIASAPFAPPDDVSWQLATAAQGLIATAVSSYAAVQLPNPAPPMGIDGLLELGGIYGNFQTIPTGDAAVVPYNRKAVLVVTNNDLTDECTADGVGAPSAASAAAYAYANQSIYTYVIMLANPFDAGADEAYPGAAAIADAGGTAFINATSNANAASAFNTVIADLSTCLYATPTSDFAAPVGDAGPATTLSYTQVTVNGSSVATSLQPINLDPTCSRANAMTANGWNVENGQIRICGAACNAMKASFLTAATVGIATAAAAVPNLPVVLQTKNPCP